MSKTGRVVNSLTSDVFQLNLKFSNLLCGTFCTQMAATLSQIPLVMNMLSSSCKKFGLTISLDKTVVMRQPPQGIRYSQPSIYVDGVTLKVIERWVACSIDKEICLRIDNGSAAFAALRNGVWSRKRIRTSTKIAVYNSCIVCRLLYSWETWATYRRHIRLPERFHQQCLQTFMTILFADGVRDTDILFRARVSSIEGYIHHDGLLWSGHVVRMSYDRIPIW